MGKGGGGIGKIAGGVMGGGGGILGGAAGGMFGGRNSGDTMGMISAGITGGPAGLMGAMQGQAGAEAAAAAARAAGIAQLREARAQYQQTAGIINPATTAGLLSLDKDIANQERNLSRQEALISQIDPTVIEASQQALRLLRGESSSTLKPIQDQRGQQRQQLVNMLRQQMGPGAETSSAGMKALNQFDMQTNSLLSSQQQSALAGLGNISSQFSAQRPDMLREIMGRSNFGQAKTNLSFDQARELRAARSGMFQSAAGPYTGQLMMGQYQQAAGAANQAAGVQNQQQAMQIGASMLSMMSDARAKTDLVQLPVSQYSEVPTYSFRYIDEKYGKGYHIGVLAQDLLRVNSNHPAVSQGSDGYYRVDYSRVK